MTGVKESLERPRMSESAKLAFLWSAFQTEQRLPDVSVKHPFLFVRSPERN